VLTGLCKFKDANPSKKTVLSHVAFTTELMPSIYESVGDKRCTPDEVVAFFAHRFMTEVFPMPRVSLLRSAQSLIDSGIPLSRWLPPCLQMTSKHCPVSGPST
jgi:hypothetical protein